MNNNLIRKSEVSNESNNPTFDNVDKYSDPQCLWLQQNITYYL